MTKSNFEKLSEEAMFAPAPPSDDELRSPGLGAIRGRDGRTRPENRTHGAVRDGCLAGIQGLDESAGQEGGQIASRAA